MSQEGPPRLSEDDIKKIRAEIMQDLIAKLDVFHVIGGEMVSVQTGEPVYRERPTVVGAYPTRNLAYDAWKAASWSNVDNAHARYLILTTPEFTEFMSKY